MVIVSAAEHTGNWVAAAACLSQHSQAPGCCPRLAGHQTNTHLLQLHLNNTLADAATVVATTQIQFYNFNAPGFAENTGHMTQLIWAAAGKIGCAANLRCSFKTWICQFTPAGACL